MGRGAGRGSVRAGGTVVEKKATCDRVQDKGEQDAVLQRGDHVDLEHFARKNGVGEDGQGGGYLRGYVETMDHVLPP